MFSFMNSSKDDIFDIEDIRQLVLTFPHENLSSSQTPKEDDLVPLESGDGFIKYKALVAAYRKFLDGKSGRVRVSDIAKHLDVTEWTVTLVTEKDEDYMNTRRRDTVITIIEQQSLAKDLYKMASQSFIIAEKFVYSFGMSWQDLDKLVRLGKESSTGRSLQLLDAPEDIDKELTEEFPYIYTLELMSNLRDDILRKVKASVEAARTVTWTESDMLGLYPNAFRHIAESTVRTCGEGSSIQGSFDIDNRGDDIRFTPQSYLLRKANQRVKEVALGTLPFCDLKTLSQKLRALLPTVAAAKEYFETQSQDRHGTPYKFHYISDYAIGDVSLNNTAKKCLETLGADRYLSTKPYLSAFPDAIQNDVQALLVNQTSLLFRSLGGNTYDIEEHGPYIITCALISDLEFVAKRLTTEYVNHQWNELVDVLTVQEALADPKFLQVFYEESDVDLDLLSRLWANTDRGIYLAAKTAYDDRLSQLRTDAAEQFTIQWKSRVVCKVQLYTQGLLSLRDSPLKESLQELLYTYISQDLIPSNLDRAKAKSLIRSPLTSKNIKKLEEAIRSASKEKSSPLDALAKFTKKMNIESATEDELVTAKNECIRDIAQSMEKDKDGPRLFLGALTNLFASKHEGILYATGKYAPRLLKFLKDDLEAGLVAKLEEIKEAVKAGKVDDAMREHLRSIAKDAIAE
ncbi:hypothetical protein EJ08DRAFT_157081 [Tothia fuscella]|uniref:Uncharacterized protein n=1 Tax=Tothia fuscella TaxID=1048955 RepID=A0A9P4P1U3_9PEZI|nr:hypothetical protein EJ08DRAFT_157081 [Tothia fuscella]